MRPTSRLALLALVLWLLTGCAASGPDAPLIDPEVEALTPRSAMAGMTVKVKLDELDIASPTPPDDPDAIASIARDALTALLGESPHVIVLAPDADEAATYLVSPRLVVWRPVGGEGVIGFAADLEVGLTHVASGEVIASEYGSGRGHAGPKDAPDEQAPAAQRRALRAALGGVREGLLDAIEKQLVE